MRCFLICLIYLSFVFESDAQVNTSVASAFTETQHRQFDFWIGEWDVNLRIQQEDATWKDAVQSTARIYRILDGKAILELWNENKEGLGIKGYSLRYYNNQKEKWELWLNWPGKNRSGSSSLEGSFRHGRGDFYSESAVDDSTMLISRYSFNDITPNSLRWDDAYSRDGGKTWTNSWIMEFTRTRDLAPSFNHKTTLLTYDSGERCDLPEFRELEKMEGSWKGKMYLSETDKTTDLSMEVFKVLDGCAIMAFKEYVIDDHLKRSFSLVTFNTFANQFEETVLDNEYGTIVETYYGKMSDNILSIQVFDKAAKKLSGKKKEWTIDDERIEIKQLSQEGDDWSEFANAILYKN